MKQRVLDVKLRTELGGAPFTSPSVEVAVGEYRRTFVRNEGTFTLRGAEEIAAVQGTGLFEVVEGTERQEEAPAPAEPNLEESAVPAAIPAAEAVHPFAERAPASAPAAAPPDDTPPQLTTTTEGE